MVSQNNGEENIEKASRVCPWQKVHLFDNFLRPLFHNTKKLFGPYVKSGMTALDIGCGRGFASIGLAELVGNDGKVISADLQPEMLEMVRQRGEKAGLISRISTHQCKSDSIGVTEKVDFALSFWMVHEVPDQLEFIREVFNLLKPGGVFFIAEPCFHVSGKEFEKLVESANEIGFQVLKRPFVLFSRAVVLLSK